MDIPQAGKISKDAKECMQECASELLSFITSEYPFWGPGQVRTWTHTHTIHKYCIQCTCKLQNIIVRILIQASIEYGCYFSSIVFTIVCLF